MSDHRLTIVNEGNGYTPICACGWTGRTCKSEMGARMEYGQLHRWDTP